MLNNKDPLVDSVKRVMEENALRAEVETLVNESYGITSRKALPYEALEEYDAVLAEAIAEALEEEKDEYVKKHPWTQEAKKEHGEHAREAIKSNRKKGFIGKSQARKQYSDTKVYGEEAEALDENSAEDAGGVFGGARAYTRKALENDKKNISAQWKNDIKPTLKSVGAKGATNVRGVVRDMMGKSMNDYIKAKLEKGVKEETLNEIKKGDAVRHNGEIYNVVHVHTKDNAPSVRGNVKVTPGSLEIQKAHGRASYPKHVESHEVEALDEEVQQINEIGDTPAGRSMLGSYLQKTHLRAPEEKKEADNAEKKRQKYSGKKIHVGAAVKKKGAPWKKSRKSKARYASAKHKEWSEKALKTSKRVQNRSVGHYRAIQRLKEEQLDEKSGITGWFQRRRLNKKAYAEWHNANRKMHVANMGDYGDAKKWADAKKWSERNDAWVGRTRATQPKDQKDDFSTTSSLRALKTGGWEPAYTKTKYLGMKEENVFEEIRYNLTESIYDAFLEGGDTFDQLINNLTEEELNLLSLNEISDKIKKPYQDAAAGNLAYERGKLKDDAHYDKQGKHMTKADGSPKFKERTSEQKAISKRKVMNRLSGLRRSYK